MFGDGDFTAESQRRRGVRGFKPCRTCRSCRSFERFCLEMGMQRRVAETQRRKRVTPCRTCRRFERFCLEMGMQRRVVETQRLIGRWGFTPYPKYELIASDSTSLGVWGNAPALKSSLRLCVKTYRPTNSRLPSSTRSTCSTRLKTSAPLR